MNNKSFTEKIISYQTKNTPATDKLAHYFWGNRWWAFAGTLIALSILLLAKLFFVVSIWCLPIVVLPYLTARIAAEKKEKRDATGLGNSEKLDIKYTVAPSCIQCFLLVVIVICLLIK
jgi:hypothetical protein